MLEPLSLHPLGATNIQVPSLCVGCAALGDMPETFAYSVAEEQALATIQAIFEGPISFADTAASYGDGESERRIGVVLRELGGLPAGFVLSTKADRNLLTSDFSGDQMRRSVERSLKLLGVDRLQICYLHDPEHIGFTASMAPRGPVETLQRLHETGVIQHLGIAGGPIRPDDPICRNRSVCRGHLPQLLYTAEQGSRSVLGRMSAARGRGDQCCPLWFWHPCQRPRRLSEIYVQPGIRCLSPTSLFPRSSLSTLSRTTGSIGLAVLNA